jgi:hypothetical protein
MKLNRKNKINSKTPFLSSVFKIWILTSIMMVISILILNFIEHDTRIIQGFIITILLSFIFSFPAIVILTFIVKYIRNRFFR